MSNEPPPGWPGQQPPWGGGYPPAPPGAYSPPGYPGYPPAPVYPGPGYPGYPPPGYGYPPPGYGPYPPVPAWQPGVIPLRPLALSDIFNGAIGYMRANPKATLGLTTVIVLITSAIGFFTGLAANRIGDSGAQAAGFFVGIATTLVATILLSGMLTVVVARAVRGSTTTAGDAWQRVRGRVPALIGLTLLEMAVAGVLSFVVLLTIVGVAKGANGVAAAILGIPLGLGLIAALVAMYGLLSLAPVAVVLEQRTVPDAIRRSIALCRPRFWRILGILVLVTLIAGLVSGVLSIPFSIAGHLLSAGAEGESPRIVGSAIAGIGQVIAQVITAPFVAGVVTLLYVDARIRSEGLAMDLVAAPATNDDTVWLRR